MRQVTIKIVLLFVAMISSLVTYASEHYMEYVDSADTYINNKEWAKAEEFILKALHDEPANYNNSLLLSNLATIQRIEGRNDEAVNNYSLALNITPNSVTLLNNRGMLYYELDSLALAKRDFARVMELDKKDVDSRYMYSIILIEESDLKAAKDVIDDMKFISPISAETVEVQARWNQASGKYKDAIKQYTLLLSKKERVDWIISRAECHLAVRNLTPAGNDINDALKIEPENAYLYLLKAKLNKFLYQNDESLKNLEKAVSYGISREYAEAFVSEAAQN